MQEGDRVQFWRRDVGGKSELVFAEILELIEPHWCYIRRLDTGEERRIDLSRLSPIGVDKERKERAVDQEKVEELGQSLASAVKYTKPIEGR